MKNKKGFTLIELLAVIIILGVLMIIAVPSVTKYINESKKNGYVSTAKELAGSARTLAYSGNYTMDDKDTTYYIDGECLKTENAYRSPYGKFEHAYIAVTATDNDHEYYWFSVDETGTGVRILTNVEKLEMDSIESGIESSEISPNIVIDKRKNIVIYSGKECTKTIGRVDKTMSSKTGKIREACPEVTETIYWALRDTDSDEYYDKLIISDSSVSGGLSGSFAGNTVFDDYYNSAPWSNYNGYISNVEIIGTVVPTSTAYWFYNFGDDDLTFTSNIEDLEVCRVTTMNSMFTYSDISPFVFDFSNWDTSNVVNMSYMFKGAGSNATSFDLNLSDWDTSNITDMSNIFEETGKYSESSYNLNLSGWDTSKVTNMSYMFANSGVSSSTYTINFTGWDTRNVTNMSNMFAYSGYNASSYNVNVNNWNTSSLVSAAYMFYSAAQHTPSFNFDLSNWNTSKLESINCMFKYFGISSTGDISLNLNNWDTSNITSMSQVFTSTGQSAQRIYINIGGWNMSNVTDMSGGMFGASFWSATSVDIIVPSTNGNGINNTTEKIYGKTSSVYSYSPYETPFTLAS